MKILGIDTSTDFLSIAIVSEEGLIFNLDYLSHRRHSSDLIPLINQVLKKSDLSLKEIDGFAVSIGPGSFTGLRVGVSTVKGLALACGKPVIGVPTLDVIARNAMYFPGIICPLIDARKDKVYSALYQSKNNNLKKISGYLLIPLARLMTKINRRKVLFLGDGIGRYKNDISKTFSKAEFAFQALWFPRANVVALMGLEALSKGRQDDPYELAPMYLYSRECSITGK